MAWLITFTPRTDDAIIRSMYSGHRRSSASIASHAVNGGSCCGSAPRHQSRTKSDHVAPKAARTVAVYRSEEDLLRRTSECGVEMILLTSHLLRIADARVEMLNKVGRAK